MKLKKKMKLNWKKIWEEFDIMCSNYYDKHTIRCSKCKHTHCGDPEWETQQLFIQKIINKILTEREKDKIPGK